MSFFDSLWSLRLQDIDRNREETCQLLTKVLSSAEQDFGKAFHAESFNWKNDKKGDYHEIKYPGNLSLSVCQSFYSKFI